VPTSRIARKQPADRPGEPLPPERLFRRAEVRDVLAWVRLLVDPQDAAAVVRALARAPIELRQVHLARVIALARRRKLDLVAGCAAAIESPQIPPEARERIERFIALHAHAEAALASSGAEAFIHGLIESLSMPRKPLLAPAQAERQRAGLRRLENLASEFVRAEPEASADELARHLAAIAIETSPATEELATGGGSATDDPVQATFERLRDDVLEGVVRIGGRLSELRLDTDLDVAHGVVRYLELIKLAAVLQRSPDSDIREALDDINARLLASATSLEREIFQSSTLDELLIDDVTARGDAGDTGERTRRGAVAGGGAERSARLTVRGLGGAEELSLVPFLPRKGRGLALSASDVAIYRSCPLRYKFARVLRIPTEQTLGQRFGIVVHQVLERYHAAELEGLEDLFALFDAGWRRAGLGDGEVEQALREKGYEALRRYYARLQREPGMPVWFERSFNFRLGPHHIRGRVDRVDRIAGVDGDAFELIDYKTSRVKPPAELREDIQLSLYALAAREDWQLDSVRLAYHYVLDDRKVDVPCGPDGPDAVRETVLEVGEGILSQQFAATPSRPACAMCDYRITCPVAEA
jgi:DNA helicase-2/ATP-dependent DNA helicase PcrA